MGIYDLIVPNFSKKFDRHLLSNGINPNCKISNSDEAEKLSNSIQAFVSRAACVYVSRAACVFDTKRLKTYGILYDQNFYKEFYRFWKNCLHCLNFMSN